MSWMAAAESLCLAACSIAVLYYLAIIVYAGITADFSWIWLAAGIFFFILNRLLHVENQTPGSVSRWLLGGLLGLTVMGVLMISILVIRIAGGMNQKPVSDLDYVIVLGAQVKKNVPSRALRKRLDAAVTYARENSRTILILSGGKGSGEDITEAFCMYQYLTEAGIDPERLRMEDRSTSTYENLVYSKAFGHPEQYRTGLISNNFHIYRATCLAKRLGYEQVYGICASADALMQPHNVLREAAALVKIYLFS